MLVLIQYQSTHQSSLFMFWIISSRIKMTQGFFPFFFSFFLFSPKHQSFLELYWLLHLVSKVHKSKQSCHTTPLYPDNILIFLIELNCSTKQLDYVSKVFLIFDLIQLRGKFRVSLAPFSPHIMTHSTPQLLFQLCVRGHMAQAREKQGVNSEVFLRSGRKCLVLNYVICLIHEDRFAIPIKLT